MKARIGQLYKTEKEWNNYPDFVPLSGELVIFSKDENYSYSRLKVGDGKTKLKDLTFFIDSAIDDHVTHRFITDIIDAGRVSEYKNK
jgi:ribosome-associated toxin RatA of RatAB toxin-antitoxin module